MISLEAYSRPAGTPHAAPVDGDRWQRFPRRRCDVMESLHGIFAGDDSEWRQVDLLPLPAALPGALPTAVQPTG